LGIAVPYHAQVPGKRHDIIAESGYWAEPCTKAYHRWKANLRVLEIEEIKSLPHVPISHPFVERLIGGVRRELLDHTFFWTATDLENKLREYQCYYNECRTHSGHDSSTPIETTGSKVIDINKYRWEKHCRGLFELPIAA
jgi:hypothetical protein